MLSQFVVKEQKGNPVPRIVNWYGKLDIRKLNRKEYRKLPPYVLLEMETGMDILYPDVLLESVFLVSREVMELLVHYDDRIPFVALFGGERQESASYFCPVLEESNEVQDKPIYRLLKKEGNEIRIRLDLAESLLARGAIGLILEERECSTDKELTIQEGKGEGTYGEGISGGRSTT